MCGICGVAGRTDAGIPIDEATLREMTRAIRHRGPDDEGFHLEPGIALGARRLSIIDLAGSAQPLANEDRSVWTVFNGEIYNFRELRGALTRSGHQFATRGDTETIVHLYEQYGVDFPRHLRGMFAIALWDSVRRRLVLARDRMGVKPLYYTVRPDSLEFASEVKSLIAGGLIDPVLDPTAAELFMAWGFVPGPATLFAGVRKLTPACVLVWEEGRLVAEQEYWNRWDHVPEAVGHDWRADEERLLELLDRSVEARMVSDVPLGVMLSGGLDSTLVTALMKRHASGPVKTFSIGFTEDKAANELDDARRVARRLGTEHHELTTSALDYPDLLDEALWHLEEPIADLSCVAFLLISRLARESVTVALTGQGADELFGGYRKHQVAAVSDAVARSPTAARNLLAAAGRLAPVGSTIARGAAAITAADAAERQQAMSRVVQAHERAEIFTPEFLQADAEREISQTIRQYVNGRADSVLDETLYLDSRLALVDNMFLYFDKMSMAASLEVRVPFMDHDLVSFCCALPDSRRVWHLRRKELLRRAARGLVDPSTLGKRKRGFFRAALGAWLRVNRDTVCRDVLLDERTRSRGLYREPAVRALLDAHGGKKADQRLFCLLLLEQWQRFFVDADGAGRHPSTKGAEPAYSRA
jgi:asparagine synthase (glutamine-hydrolysing)